MFRKKLLKVNKRALTVSSALLTRGIGSGLQFILNVTLGRLLGADGVGVYYLYVTWTNLLAHLGSLGFPLYTLRHVSALDGVDEHAKANQLVRKSVLICLVSGAVILLNAFFFAKPLATIFLNDERLSFVVIYAASGGLFLILVKLLAGALKARGRAVIALSFENSAVPTGILFVVMLAVYLAFPITVNVIIWLHIFFMIVVTALSAFIWMRTSRGIKVASKRQQQQQISRRSLVSFWGLILLSSSFNMIPTFLLPQFANTSEIGQFGVAHRLVTLASIILVALASIYSPRFSQHATRNDVESLKKDLKESQLYSFFAYLPFLIAVTFFSKPILSIFGEEFTQASLLLWILAYGQLIHAVSGLVGNFLNMTGRESLELKLSIAFAVVLVVLTFLLGHLFGVVGVAIAYAISVAFKNIATYVAVKMALRQMKSSLKSL